MEQRIIRNKEHWVVDEDGDVLGFDHGTRTQYLVTVETNPLTGGIELNVAGASLPTVFLLPSGDTTGVQDATRINAAIAALAGTGQARLVLKGDYYVRATNRFGAGYQAIMLASNITIDGMGNAKITLAASAEPNGWGGFIFFGSEVNNVTITGVELDGNRAAFTSPAFASGQDGIAGSNIRLIDSTDVTVKNCISHSAIYHGLFAVDGCRRITFRENKIYNCGYRAMHFNGIDGANNDITDSAFDDNECWSNAQAADNTTNGGIFIALGDSFRISCQRNRVKDDARVGIEITGTGTSATVPAREVIVAGNHISGCPEGIRTGNNLTDCLISGNIISGASLIGMSLGVMTGVRVTGNIVRRCAMGVKFGLSNSDALVGVSLNGNTFDDNDAETGQKAVVFINTGQHVACQINDNLFVNNGVTGATVASAIVMGDPSSNRAKSLQICRNTMRGNKGHGVVVFDTDNAQICGNQFMDNYESSGPRGRAIWVRGSADGTLVKDNISVNDNVTNSLEQIYFDATTTASRVADNTAECSAANKFVGASGATGAAYGNTGTASWPVGFVTGTSAI